MTAAMAATTSSSLWVCRPSVSCASSTVNYASCSFLQGAQTKKLKVQLQGYGGRGKATVAMTIAPPPWPPVNPDTDKEEGDASVGMEEALKQEKVQEEKEKTSDDVFVWRDHWYPVSLIEDLDVSVPTPFQLLGRELVVWKDSQGEWRVFLDKCLIVWRLSL